MADSTSCNPPCCGGSGTPGAKVENQNVCIKLGGCTIIGLTEVVDTTDISNPTWTYFNADGDVVAGPLTHSAAVKCPQDVNIASTACPPPIPAQLVCLKRIGSDDPVFRAWAVGCATCDADTIKVSLFSSDGQTKLDPSLFQITLCC